MELNQQVCSLEYAQRLKELGVNQESLFYYAIGGVVYRSEMPFFMDSNYSAFTVGELGEYFEKEIVSGKDFSGSYFCRAILPNGEDMITTDNENEANTRAKMLIYLIEQGLVKVEDINNVS
jgi:hypothetical protein